MSSCSLFNKEPQVVTVTKVIESSIDQADRPRPVSLNDVQFFVVTRENLEPFLEKMKEQNGDVVFYAISVRDYETLAMNMVELRRYIIQQKEIIVYYENSIKENDENE